MSSNMKNATPPQAKSRFQRETLVSDSATLESLFRSNWPLRRSEAALNCEPDNLSSYGHENFSEVTGDQAGKLGTEEKNS